MADNSAMTDFDGVYDDVGNPPAKRPCLDPQAAASNIADPAADDSSDFYNTPLNSGTPVHTTESTRSNTGGFTNSQPSTPQKPLPQIPGLTLCYGFNNDDAQLAPPQSEEPRGANCGGSALRQVVMATEVSPTGEPQNQDLKAIGGDDSQMRDTNMDTVSGDVDSAPGDEADKQVDTTMLVAQAATREGIPSNLNEIELPTMQAEGNGEPEWEVDSSPYESPSTSDSSDTSSDDESDSDDEDDEDDEDYELLEPEAQAQLLMAADGASDDEVDGKGASKTVRTTNEKEEEAVPIPDVTVTPDTKVEMLGNVEHIIDNVLLIKANISGEYQVLESGSVLCLANLNVIGVVSETLGKVEQPMYTVRFSSAAAIKDLGIEDGAPVFYIVDHSTFVFTQPLKGLKGSDASNFHDEEVGEDEVEFSDDEAEAEHKRQLKLKRQQKKGVKTGNRKDHGQTGPGPSGLRNSELNYDDVDMDDGYTPLARPKNLHEMMASQEPPQEQSHPHMDKNFRGGRGRGRGRGHDRGGRHNPGRGRGKGHHHRADRDQQYAREQRDRSDYPPSAGRSPYHHDNVPQQQQPAMSPFVQQAQSFSPYQTPFQMSPGHVNPNSPSAMPNSPGSFPLMPPFQQQQAPPFPPPGSHINPAFFANATQQSQDSLRPFPSQAAGTQGSDDTFAAAQAQLDLLRRLSRGAS